MTDTLNRPRLSREERAAQEAEKAWRRRFFGWVALVLVLLLGAGAAYALWFTPVLGVSTVQISAADGTLTVDQDAEVRAAAGIEMGTPLIRIDLDDVATRVEALPDVADAQVSRHWPGTLRITVTLRYAVAVVAANSSWYLLDAAGHPFDQVAAPPDGVVQLRLATPGPADPATLAGLTVVQALTDQLRPLVTTVSAHSTQNITLELVDGRTVLWGTADDSQRKAAVLPAVLTRPGTQFDVSDPELVTVR